MKKDRVLIDGAPRDTKWLNALHSASIVHDDVFDRLELKTSTQIAEANRSIALVKELLETMSTFMHGFHMKKRFLQRVADFFGPPPRVDSIEVSVVSLANYCAFAYKGSPYRIELSIGAIVRTASLCNEISAILHDGVTINKPSSIYSSSIHGKLFETNPSSTLSRNSADRLTLIGILLLFGHEFSHVCHGHCDLNVRRKLSDDERCAIESDADLSAGSTAAGTILQNKSILDLIHITATPSEEEQKNLMRDAVMSSLVQFILLQEFSDNASRKYLVPAIRQACFFSSFINYIAWLPKAPLQPVFHILPKYLDDAFAHAIHTQCIETLKSSSIESAITNISFREDDFIRLQSISNLRDKLKVELAPLRPFGMVDYLKFIGEKNTN
ncbi:hypothetical protein [Massilia sp. CFBP9026]|uniref:hypothetical protein n=1 Tax=Massilia sp. CFBP9026 TaxID=3096536 RepID=UPI002A6A209D|nr:hypothetical protein [Massilia sp. CFBP9026]MDY0960790.1 hypothetical protein [Massilia sp. CFBP9026]